MLATMVLAGLLASAPSTFAVTAATAGAWHPTLGFSSVCPSTPLIPQLGCWKADSSQSGGDVHLQSNETASTDESEPPPSEWTGGRRCAGPFCLYSNRGFANGRGIVVITDESNLEKIKAKEAVLARGGTQMNLNQDTGDDDTTTTTTPSKYRVAGVPGKGFGVLAARSLTRGDSLMAASPVLLAHRGFMERTPKTQQLPLLDLVPSLLPAETRRAFLRQMGHFGGHKISDILTTNSFQLDIGTSSTASDTGGNGGEAGPGSDGHHYGNYPEVSRLNHDCRPNLAFFVDAETLTHKTTVVRDVAPGEELTISYLDVMAPSAARRHRAQMAWGFECACAACAAGDAPGEGKEAASASDARLREIQELEAKLSSLEHKVELGTVEKYLSLFEEEGLEAAMAGALTTAALNANLLGRDDLAVEYAKRAIQAGEMEKGPRGADVEAMRSLGRSPRAHFTWRRRLNK